MAQQFGAGRTPTAKRTLAVGLALTAVVLCGLGATIIAVPRPIAALFSSDPQVHAAFASVRYSLAATAVLMNLACTLEGLLMTTGRTKTVLVVGVLGSWAGQVLTPTPTLSQPYPQPYPNPNPRTSTRI